MLWSDLQIQRSSQVLGTVLLGISLSWGYAAPVDQTILPALQALPGLAMPAIALAFPDLTGGDASIFQDIAQRTPRDRSLSHIMQDLAEQFLGAPYAAGLLDQGMSEQFVVTFDQFDCVLFVETVLALARTLETPHYTTQTFTQHLGEQRYRDGVMAGYCSRLHYFADWILDNQSRGIVTDLTGQLGGVPLQKTIDFMSTHRHSYPQLDQAAPDGEANYQCIVAQEARLNQQEIRYIPTAQIAEVYDALQPGDIVAIATAVPGLDVTHTGLVYQTSNQTGLIHAAPGGGVRIAADLQTYVARVEDAIGILVARPHNPQNFPEH